MRRCLACLLHAGGRRRFVLGSSRKSGTHRQSVQTPRNGRLAYQEPQNACYNVKAANSQSSQLHSTRRPQAAGSWSLFLRLLGLLAKNARACLCPDDRLLEGGRSLQHLWQAFATRSRAAPWLSVPTGEPRTWSNKLSRNDSFDTWRPANFGKRSCAEACMQSCAMRMFCACHAELTLLALATVLC